MEARESSISIGVIFWPALVMMYGLLIAMGIWFIWGGVAVIPANLGTLSRNTPIPGQLITVLIDGLENYTPNAMGTVPHIDSLLSSLQIIRSTAQAQNPKTF